MTTTRSELFRKHASMDVPSWAPRTQAIARLIPPGVSVVDVGAGSGYLGRVLGDKIKSYFPADVVGRENMTRWNVAGEPCPKPLAGHDVVVCVGVLEYLEQPSRALVNMRPCGRVMIVTYNLKELRDAGVGGKMWRSNWSLPEMRSALTSAGWCPVYSERPDKRQIIVRALRRPLPEESPSLSSFHRQSGAGPEHTP